ncbi:MAG: redoxin family protein [Gemmatimonadetes bacterium]|nr:TlpA family protein disulfide reductase [Gemmatimonadota bacterium]NIQ52664.1 TlpA family protein disulfide reductase [Gemmatimonadota bacterium]NIU72800.1 redoxin family protein [Gammaproteobacteria bacterium]NIX43189.1 redoxin family protein [Gemmatimonadota bacterium]NIY07354.1 redoxin family protein [Gemmatimonadota bacterium]
MRRRSRAIALVVAAGAATACGDPDPAPGTVESERAPALSAVTLEGDSVRLADLQGEVVLLNVWATWCVPCRKEVPELQALHEAHGARGLHVIGITVDNRGAEDQVRRFIEEFGMTYDIWWDPDQSVIQKLGAIGVPLTVLIDREGRIAWRHLGAFEQGDPELLEAVEEALGPDPAGA